MICGTNEFQTKLIPVKNTPPTSKAPLVNRIFMPLILLFLVQLLTISKANGQIVRFIHNAYKAEYYVFETTDSAFANYFVYRASNPTEARVVLISSFMCPSKYTHVIVKWGLYSVLNCYNFHCIPL